MVGKGAQGDRSGIIILDEYFRKVHVFLSILAKITIVGNFRTLEGLP
jgi:hypothetical protein